jgi:DNA-binding GntR family transcriptional regulator
MSKRIYAYNTIRNAITYGDLKPGERIVEKTLSEMFKVGRTPLREALKQLEIEGYLEFIPNKGVTIRKISIADMEDIYGILSVLEGYAAEMAIKYLNSDGIKKIQSIQNDQKRAWAAKDYGKWVDKNAEFHEYIITASKNTFLTTTINNLRRRVYRFRLVSVTIPGFIEENIQSHEGIIKAICEKESARAGKAMQKHVAGAAKTMADFLKEHPVL